MSKVLIVDDARFMRNVLKACVLECGHEVIEASDGEECLRLVDSESPDLIMLDLVMPKLDGFQVLENLRVRPSAPPIIVMTADIQKSVKERVLELGAKAFLNKPPEREAVVAAITAVFEEVAVL